MCCICDSELDELYLLRNKVKTLQVELTKVRLKRSFLNKKRKTEREKSHKYSRTVRLQEKVIEGLRDAL